MMTATSNSRGASSPTVALRVSAHFLSAYPEFVWLKRLQCLAVGEFDSESSRAGWDVYAVRRPDRDRAGGNVMLSYAGGPTLASRPAPRPAVRRQAVITRSSASGRVHDPVASRNTPKTVGPSAASR